MLCVWGCQTRILCRGKQTSYPIHLSFRARPVSFWWWLLASGKWPGIATNSIPNMTHVRVLSLPLSVYARFSAGQYKRKAVLKEPLFVAAVRSDRTISADDSYLYFYASEIAISERFGYKGINIAHMVIF